MTQQVEPNRREVFEQWVEDMASRSPDALNAGTHGDLLVSIRSAAKQLVGTMRSDDNSPAVAYPTAVLGVECETISKLTRPTPTDLKPWHTVLNGTLRRVAYGSGYIANPGELTVEIGDSAVHVVARPIGKIPARYRLASYIESLRRMQVPDGIERKLGAAAITLIRESMLAALADKDTQKSSE